MINIIRGINIGFNYLNQNTIWRILIYVIIAFCYSQFYDVIIENWVSNNDIQISVGSIHDRIFFEVRLFTMLALPLIGNTIMNRLPYYKMYGSYLLLIFIYVDYFYVTTIFSQKFFDGSPKVLVVIHHLEHHIYLSGVLLVIILARFLFCYKKQAMKEYN